MPRVTEAPGDVAYRRLRNRDRRWGHEHRDRNAPAVAEALARGLVRKSKLIEAAKTNPRSQHLLRILNYKLPKPKGKVG